MTYIELKDVDVDGWGTDITTLIQVDTDGLTNGTIERIKNAINNCIEENMENWGSDDCCAAAIEQLEKEGYKAKYVIPSTTICF